MPRKKVATTVRATKKPVRKSVKQTVKKNTEFSTTIFDDMYRTLISRMPQFIIPVINDAFGTRYPMDVEFEQLKNEFYRKEGKLVTDSIFLIKGRLYHIECQTRNDNTMAIRMFEYGIEIAMERARKDKDYLHVNLPESAVIYLRHTNSTPDRLTVEVSAPNGQKMTYESKVIKVQDYTKDMIFRKKLLLFLPFYAMRYENELKTLDQDSDRLQALVKEYLGIYQKMEKVLEENGASELYGDLMGYIMQILDYLLKSQKKARKEMNNMGGKILESFSEKERRAGEKGIVSAVKDIRNGVKTSELKKKYSEETIKRAKTIA